MDAHTDATRYHVHGQKKPDDAGKPDAVKAARPVWRGPVRKRSSDATFAGWLPYPDPEYARKKKWRDTLIALAQRYGWEVGYLDEVWWSRVRQPNLHSWSEKDEPLRLQELSKNKDDPDPKALACYGMPEAKSSRMHLLTTSELKQRVCDYLSCELLEPLTQQVA